MAKELIKEAKLHEDELKEAMIAIAKAKLGAFGANWNPAMTITWADVT